METSEINHQTEQVCRTYSLTSSTDLASIVSNYQYPDTPNQISVWELQWL